MKKENRESGITITDPRRVSPDKDRTPPADD
jgi:hypothetical protein